MHSETCARASSAMKQSEQKPLLTIAGINQAQGFDVFLNRQAFLQPELVVAELSPLQKTHRFQRDLMDVLNKAKRRLEKRR
jgi:hypothetical protein